MPRLLLFARMAMLAVFSLLGLASCGPPQRANILLITLDTVRTDHLSAYGYERDTTPALVDLAAESYVFEHAQASAAVTPVSHASILTGLHPYRHGLRALHGKAGSSLALSQNTLAEILLEEGYETAAFVSAFTSSSFYGLQQGFETWDQQFDLSSVTVQADGLVDNGSAQRSARDVVDAACNWLDGRSDPAAPFFAWVHFFDAHDDQLVPPDQDRRRYLETGQSQEEQWIATYDGDLRYIDTQISRLFGKLHRQGLYENTIIVVLGDHGEALGDRGWWGHTLLFQEHLRVPFILRIPGHPGQRITAQTRTIDFVPTILELVDIPAPERTFDGSSLVRSLEEGRGPDLLAYSETLQDLAAYRESEWSDESWFAANDGRWKLILRRTPEGAEHLMLFDLIADPSESSNVITQYPGEADRLRRALRPGERLGRPRAESELDPEVLEKLRSLGYLDSSKRGRGTRQR